VFVVRNDALTKVPCQIETLVKTWGDAVTYYNANGDDAKTIISTAVGATPADLKTAFDGVKIYDLAEAKALLDGDFPKTMTDIMKIAVAAGIMPGEIDPAKLLDTTFVDKVAQ
jgi:NitT/TauT family transport system substrate-binding protein